MEYYDEDFYRELSEFDSQVEDFKSTLAQSVKDEFKSEMERLKAENAELQKVKADWEAIQREYANKHRQLEFDRKELERKIKHERLSVLMKDFEVTMYTTEIKWVRLPKCEKCDRSRKVEYTTPRGRKAYEDCECSIQTKTYVPEEYVCSSFAINRRDAGKLNAWYKRKESDGEEHFSRDSSFAEVVWQEGMAYDQLNKDKTFFKTIAECQAYCDWLNTPKVKDGDTHAANPL